MTQTRITAISGLPVFVAVLWLLSSAGVVPVGAEATTSTTVLTIPASVRITPGTKALIEACVGEPVAFAGDGLLLIHRTTLPNDSWLLVVHSNPHEVIALGASSGTTYRLGASDTLARFVAPSGTFVATFTANLHVIGPGGALGFYGRILGHVTVTPEGDITVDIEVFDIRCR